MSKTLRVFEAFAGIGAQVSALKRLNIKYEVVGISEWFINAIHCYSAIHCGNVMVEKPENREQAIEYLKKFTFSKDSVHPINDISKLSTDELEKLYISNKKTKNLGSITEIKAEDIPEFDLLVYSFPCQDLSTGGKTEGMGEGSGTRSSLLWEIKTILLGLQKIKRLPKYLLMENVKAVLAESNKKDLDKWLSFLEKIGYTNSEKIVLNSLNFGVPQSRKRAFIISSLGKEIPVKSLKEYQNPNKIDIKKFILHERNQNEFTNEILKKESNQAQLNRTISREEMWRINGRETISNETIIHTITCNMDRSNTAAMFRYDGPKGDTYRLLTIREAFLLMGFNEEEYLKAAKLGLSYRKMNKLIGNSIVVNVLEQIFKVIYADFTKEESDDEN